MHPRDERSFGVGPSSAGDVVGTRPWRGLSLPPRNKVVEWGTAALAAAGLLFVSGAALRYWIARPHGAHESLVAYGGLLVALVCIYLHVRLEPEPRSALRIAAVAAVLNVVALVGVFLFLLVGGGCYDNGHIPSWTWPVAAVIYLVGGAAGLRSRWYAAWAVPLSTLVAGGWLAVTANALTGSTGFCLD